MALLGEPPRTQFDFGFSVFGFRVRVCAFFWLAAILLGQGAASLGAKFLLLWIAAMFLSILIHELGHAFAFRHFGISARIVIGNGQPAEVIKRYVISRSTSWTNNGHDLPSILIMMPKSPLLYHPGVEPPHTHLEASAGECAG